MALHVVGRTGTIDPEFLNHLVREHKHHGRIGTLAKDKTCLTVVTTRPGYGLWQGNVMFVVMVPGRKQEVFCVPKQFFNFIEHDEARREEGLALTQERKTPRIALA